MSRSSFIYLSILGPLGLNVLLANTGQKARNTAGIQPQLCVASALRHKIYIHFHIPWCKACNEEYMYSVGRLCPPPIGRITALWVGERKCFPNCDSKVALRGLTAAWGTLIMVSVCVMKKLHSEN